MIRAIVAYVGSLVCFAMAIVIGYHGLSVGGEHVGQEADLKLQIETALRERPAQMQYQHQTITPVTRIYHDARPTTKSGSELERAADRLIASHGK